MYLNCKIHNELLRNIASADQFPPWNNGAAEIGTHELSLESLINSQI